MKTIVDLQKDYDKAYQETTDVALKFIEERLKADNLKTLEALVKEIRPMIGVQFQSIYQKKINDNFYSADPFTRDLINAHDNNIKDYKNQSISAFIHKELAYLKSSNVDSLHEFKNHELSPKGIAQLLAKHHAMRNLYNKMNVIKTAEIESAEVYMEELRSENGNHVQTIDMRPEALLFKLLTGSEKSYEDVFPQKPSAQRENAPSNLTTNTKKDEEAESIEFDVNFWNQECYLLFNYLADHYKATAIKQKYINIWHYLKYLNKEPYIFNFPKAHYKYFISNRFHIDFDRAKINQPNNFEKQRIILDNHLKAYCDTLKVQEMPIKRP